MHLQRMSLMALLAAFVSTSPLRPSPKAYHFARDISLQEVDADMTGPAPGWALTSAGLAKRGKLITCQPDDDDGQTGLTKKGDKNWVPVDQWLASGSEFCSDRSGLINQIPQSQSQTFSGYAVTLTNQKSPADVGDPGHIAFFVINKSAGSSAGMPISDCYNALQHIAAWDTSPLGKSACWGSKNNDTRGGTWETDNGWVIGGAISSGSPAES
ncbi:hypothetical protein PMZ80_010046 [Knufia obscura]|uniref:Uncharacterized protein n=2 Tax=Knufia TaxID=430999 RepID=A0AAN8I7M2_9EURO|nr:hypothetical protein PMZ80_010046 [Knufia obscura]KAK5956134.1 hypothetical protein OHC33_002707 [Knufia fluminis]